MCGGGGDGGASATEERLVREKAERDAKIAEGKAAIDAAFTGFDDDFYNSYTQSITDYQLPQIGQQFDKTRNKMIAGLAGRGVLESTNSAQRLAELTEAFSDEQVRAQSGALDATNQLKANVARQQGDLYALNEAAADPAAVSQNAIGTSTALLAPPTKSPVGELFTGFLDPVIAYRSASDNAPRPRKTYNYAATGGGSGTVVR